MEWYHVCWPRVTAKRVEPVVSISWASCWIWLRPRSVYPATAMTQTSPSRSLPPPFPIPPPPFSLPFPFPPFPSLPSPPGGLEAEPPVAGSRGDPRKKMEIEIGFGVFWRIFVSKRELSSVSLFTYDPYIWGILPPSWCNSLPPEPNLDASCVHFPPVDAPAPSQFETFGISLDNKGRYSHIYASATETVQIRCI